MSTEKTRAEQSPQRGFFLSGFLAALPIILGYFPYGFAFGILAKQAGLNLFQTVFMSLVVYAGASQIVAVGLLQAGETVLAIVVATFLLNARYFLMSAALAPFLGDWSLPQRLFFGFTISDETFAVNSLAFQRERAQAGFGFGVNLTAYFCWSLFSLLGFIAGGWVADTRHWGLDFALPAVFIGLLIRMIRNRTTVLVALLAGLLAIAFRTAGFQSGSVILAALVGSALGFLGGEWPKKRST